MAAAWRKNNMRLGQRISKLKSKLTHLSDLSDYQAIRKLESQKVSRKQASQPAPNWGSAIPSQLLVNMFAKIGLINI